jgi:hypothetical protein
MAVTGFAIGSSLPEQSAEAMSALPWKADICSAPAHVDYVPHRDYVMWSFADAVTADAFSGVLIVR